MRQAFIFEKVAVLVGPWHERGNPPERGARVEVRLLDDEPRRGTSSAAQRAVIDRPLFRADLFDRLDGPTGNLRAAHFHPHFNGVEPCDRHWDDVIQRDPAGWLAAELGDLANLVARSGFDAGDGTWLAEDADALRRARPEIVRAVEVAWSTARLEA
ncbi:MAG: hypothetical protein QOE63_257 [Acidimicrobiaceae bacterium]|jgi:hypothetical protein